MEPGEETEPAQRAPNLDYDTVMEHYERISSALDRQLILMQQDIPPTTDKTILHRVCKDYEGFRKAEAAWITDSEEE